MVIMRAVGAFAVLLALTIGATGKVLFVPGQEYSYLYETLVTTGTEEPAGHASAYKLQGNLRIQAEDENSLAVKLDGLTTGLYNGPWSYFPIPEFSRAPATDLASLQEPFRIQLDNGKFKGLIMNDQEAEWSSNMKRGLATFLQMDLSLANFDKIGLQTVPEATTMGECTTRYEVLPASTSKFGVSTLSKFRNHADCGDIPMRTRFSSRTFYPCRDRNTQNIMNSTSYSTYVVDSSNPEAVTIQQLIVYSSVLYWPFTNKAPYLYTWFNMTVTLTGIKATSDPIDAVENPETHEDLAFVFEQNDLNDPEDEVQDFRSAEPLLFHHTAGESDPEVLQNIMDQLHTAVSAVADSLLSGSNYEDVEKFHQTTPFSIIPLVSSLDFESLKHCYQKYANEETNGGQKATVELQLFLDGLVMSGNWPTTLMVRDILLMATDTKTIRRLAVGFPQYIRNPTEALGKELDPIFDLTKKASLSNSIRRTIELSMATAISKCCQKTLCTGTGILDKYISYFEDMLRSNSFETQSVGAIGLRNLGLGRALDILLSIVTGNTAVQSSVRVQAIWGLYPLAFQSHDELFGALLPVFYNRSETCEIRTSIFSFLMTCQPHERVLHEIAYFMWSETCAQTSNLVRSTFLSMANSKNPCKASHSYASTVVKYLPPGTVDPTRTTSYAIDFYDEDHGFGQTTILSAQKSSQSVLPVSVYIGLHAHVGGFSTGVLGVYIRLQGVGKAITMQLANLRSANIEGIQNILSKIGVTSRAATPLKLELALMYQDKVIAYYAADDKTLENFRSGIKRLGELASTPVVDWQRSILIAGALYQQPMEIGVPISILSSIAANGIVSSNMSRSGSSGLFTVNSQTRIQANAFGITRLTNHLPGLGTAHSVSIRRTSRATLPRQVSLKLDMKNQDVSLVMKPPAEDDPAFIAAHACILTSVSGDIYTTAKDARAQELLKQSCPSCNKNVIVSKGPSFRKTKKVTFTPRFIKGIKPVVGYFDCERDTSPSALWRKIKHVLNPAAQNAGLFQTPFAKLLLSYQQVKSALLFSPAAETCGVFAKIARDSSSGHEPLEEVELRIKGKVTPSTSTSSEFKIDVTLSADAKYATAPTIKLSSFISATDSLEGRKRTTVNIKNLASQNGNETAGVMCLSVNTTMNVLPKDPLCFKDENAPFAYEIGELKWGTIPAASLDGMNTECSYSIGKLEIRAEAQQSAEQIVESEQDLFPYKQCREQKNSPLYPGDFVPASHECSIAAVEQTTLRQFNVSVAYKVQKRVKRKLRKPLGMIEGLLLPYYVEDEASDHVHDPHEHSTQNDMESGEFEVDLNVKRSGPIANVHYHSDGEDEQHFHGIDLSLLPSFLLPSPLSSRFPRFFTLGLRIGYFGVCRITPSVVNTMDNIVLPVDLPECLTLISADCGEKPRFAVLGKRTSPTTLALEVHIGRHKVELERTTVVVDGETVDLANQIQQDLPGPTSSTFKALKNGEEIYIFSRSTGLSLRYTGASVIVILDSRYRGLQCGICGAWDSSPQNDVSGPDSTCKKKLTPSEFVQSYVVRDGSCSSVGQACPA